MTERSDATGEPCPLPTHVPVLVAGGGPVGSALALALATRGMPVLLVEREHVLADNDVRVRGINARTMEFFRRLGVAEDVAAADDIPPEWYRATVVTQSLASPPQQLIPSNPDELGVPFQPGQRPPSYVAERQRIVPQPRVTRVLRDHAQRRGAIVLTGWELVRIFQTADKVRADLREVTTGRIHHLTADYAVGAEGARSLVREVAGIALDASPPQGKRISVTFTARDLFARTGQEPYAWYRIPRLGNGPGITTHARDRWGFGLGPFPLDTDFTRFDIEAEARKLIGSDDVEIEIDQARIWTVQRAVARTYRAGRLFIAGDAAHTCPPTGGQNMNTGVGDAINLAWKLAAVLSGWGGDHLLDSYSDERQPIGDRNTRWSLQFAQTSEPENIGGGQPADPGARTGGFAVKGVVLDIRYRSAAIAEEAGELPEWEPGAHLDRAVPGLRAPHAWIDADTSLFDLFGPDFTLLAFGAEDASVARLQEAARRAGVPVTLVTLDRPDIQRLYERKLVLIRPDQHVAWRGDAAPADPAGLFDIVRGAASAPAQTQAA